MYMMVKIPLGFASCNFLTVTGTIILELHSNVCDYLYKVLLVHCQVLILTYTWSICYQGWAILVLEYCDTVNLDT